MRSLAGAVIGVTIGLWMMLAPAVLGYGGSAATADRIIGPTAAAAAWIAASEITRSLRWLNLALGICALSTLLFIDHTAAATVSRVLSSAGLIGSALAIEKTPVDDYGGGWKSLLANEKRT